MKIGDVVICVVGFAGPGLCMAGEQELTVTERNKDELEAELRSGHIKVRGDFRTTIATRDRGKNEDTGVLPDNRTSSVKDTRKNPQTKGRPVLRPDAVKGQPVSSGTGPSGTEHPTELRENAADSTDAGLSKGLDS